MEKTFNRTLKDRIVYQLKGINSSHFKHIQNNNY